MPKVNRVLRTEEGKVEVVEKPYPRLTGGFVLVKQHIAPICTEQRVYDGGPLEWFEKNDGLGHEGVGEIVEVAHGSNYQVGDRVIIYQGWPCGTCLTCTQGLGATHCRNFKDLDAIEKACRSESGGYGFSQYRLAPEHMVQRIPDGLSYKHASAATCLVGCTYLLGHIPALLPAVPMSGSKIEYT